jgi:hypothetical protein
MNTKMNVLALALLGLAGYAGSAVAGCPGSPVPPWTATFENAGTATIVAPGYAGTACHLASTIAAGAGFLGSATVNWTGSTVEPRYRAQFIIDADSLTGQGFTDAVQIFNATSSAGGGGVFFNIYSFSGTRTLDFQIRGNGGAVVAANTVTLPAGEARVEFDLQTGAGTGYFKVWVNNNDEANPNQQALDLTNDTTLGVDTVFLGLSTPQPDFVTHFGGTAVGFDQFDSRRSTFIGDGT